MKGNVYMEVESGEKGIFFEAISITGGSYRRTGMSAKDYHTLFLLGESYLNLCSPGIQCRNNRDDAWAGISASGFHTQSNSSRKLKENIKEITDERARQILNVKVVTFDYKEGVFEEQYRHNRSGVIAEDTEGVCPEVINYSGGEPSGVQYDRFIPYLIRMAQIHEAGAEKQQEKIEELKKENAGLMERMRRIEAALGIGTD